MSLRRLTLCSLLCAALGAACSGDDSSGAGPAGGGSSGAAGAGGQSDAGILDSSWPKSDSATDSASDALPEASGPCPSDMALVAGACMDRYEAPNQAGELPLVMYSFDEADAWCLARDKRLCFDDEWTAACAGPLEEKYSYPNGKTHQPGVCNDDKLWKLYEQSKLNGWPFTVSTPKVQTLKQLLDAAKAQSVAAAAAADHVEWLYQAEPSGSKTGCVREEGIFDLSGNVEEWTQRRDGGTASFHGNLKGRYWADTRTCQNNITTHGDGFRFYEIGFRCCRDPAN